MKSADFSTNLPLKILRSFDFFVRELSEALFNKQGIMHGSILLVTMPPPPRAHFLGFATFSFLEVYSPPPSSLIDRICVFCYIFFIPTKRVVKGIFTTRDLPFFPREMASFFLINNCDFHSSREAGFCKIIFREARNKCLIRREPWFSLCLCFSWIVKGLLYFPWNVI